MRDPNRKRSSPALEMLEGRALLAGGVTASLSRGVLTIVGKTASDPIEVDVTAVRLRRGIQGTVAVPGVGTFNAAQVKQVVITCVVGEPLVINRSPVWNPAFRFILKKAPVVTVKPTPTPTPTPAPTPTPTPSPSALSTDEQAIVDQVNQARAANGLAPLKVSTKLVQMAHIQAQAMADLNTMSHELPQAKYPTLTDRSAAVGYNFSYLGENIAEGYPSVSSVMTAWMNSPGHRANILGSNYTEIGVAIVSTTSGIPYYCQVFGRPWS